ncbi:unnamed protein product [Aphanomyces euteiches]|uniref:Uncharacterized protein n=1 Tax=Aphanomyces euteiches TaxID=100861 RepID=A0A6G0WKB8_9STRA|nr:hypothetical protein Ae201684_014304 [Aphanomyces euteiches]KAH9137886.1 hypothetical protein AeRB84_017594 [Aphanomyces euteiches]
MKMESSREEQSMRTFFLSAGASGSSIVDDGNDSFDASYPDRNEYGNQHDTHRCDDKNATSSTSTFDKHQIKQQQQPQAWLYPDVRGGRSNSYPSMMIESTFRKDVDSFGMPSTSGSSSSMHGASRTAISRSNSAVDMLNYEVSHGIMNTPSIPEVGNNDTQKHLRAKNLPSSVLFNSGRWSNEEHNRFVQGLNQYPHGVLNRWRKISKAVGTRTVLQTRTHAQKFFRKLQKQDDIKQQASDNHMDDENHLPNGSGALSPNQGGDKTLTRSLSYSPFMGKKEEPPRMSHRMSDPIMYDSSARTLMPFNALSDIVSPPPRRDNSTYPSSNLFPSITIPSTSSAHPPSNQLPTPTTEASRAFQNISLSSRYSRDESPHPSSVPAAAQARGQGNDQWVDWLLSNIDTFVARPGAAPGSNSGGSGGSRHGRAFRSASEPVPPLHAYRSSSSSNNVGDIQGQGTSSSVWDSDASYNNNNAAAAAAIHGLQHSAATSSNNSSNYYDGGDVTPEPKYSVMLDE